MEKEGARRCEKKNKESGQRNSIYSSSTKIFVKDKT